MVHNTSACSLVRDDSLQSRSYPKASSSLLPKGTESSQGTTGFTAKSSQTSWCLPQAWRKACHYCFRLIPSSLFGKQWKCLAWCCKARYHCCLPLWPLGISYQWWRSLWHNHFHNLQMFLYNMTLKCREASSSITCSKTLLVCFIFQFSTVSLLDFC